MIASVVVRKATFIGKQNKCHYLRLNPYWQLAICKYEYARRWFSDQQSHGSRKPVYNEQEKNETKLDTNPPKGARDMYPEDMIVRNWLFGNWKKASHSFNYEEYDSSILEQEELYIRKSGEEISDQLYSFSDKSGRRLSLRPEMTPTLARMIAKRHQSLSYPLKWFSIPQCWRYEQMTRGRRREHFQWNVDCVLKPSADFGTGQSLSEHYAVAEVLSCLVSAFKLFGMSSNHVKIRLNSKISLFNLIQSVVSPLHPNYLNSQNFHVLCNSIDKIRKYPRMELVASLVDPSSSMFFISDERLCHSILDTVSSSNHDKTTQIHSNDACSHLMPILEQYGISDWVEYDWSIVRGLNYYKNIVFEVFDTKFKFRSIAGGGMYEINLFDSPNQAVGFGFGDAVIIEVLNELNLFPFSNLANKVSNGHISRPDIVVIPCLSSRGDEAKIYGYSCQIASRLRNDFQLALSVELLLDNIKVGNGIKYCSVLSSSSSIADKLNNNKNVIAVIIGDDELSSGYISVKNMTSGVQVKSGPESLTKTISDMRLS